MAARSPARFLAPLALLAFVLALYLVVSGTLTDDAPGGGTRTTEEQPASTPAAKSGGGSANAKKQKARRFYKVKAGDTPSAIAEKTGVPLSQIQELNPELNPQSLSPGQRLKIRR